MKAYALSILLFHGHVAAFGPSNVATSASIRSSLGAARSEGENVVGRRMFFSQGAIALSTSIALLSGSGSPVFADVSDGNALPQGAAQFGRIIRTKLDLQAVSKRVATGGTEMDKDEWNNVGQFLRKVYAVADDMKAIAGGFYEPDKKARAQELIDSLRKTAKAADAATGNQASFLPYTKKLADTLDEFLDLLRDVPDEI